MNRRLSIGVILLALTFSSYASTLSPKDEDIGRAAGAYYGAIMLAKEFKGTRCGDINIAKKWMDLELARKEIFSKIPKRLHRELEDVWGEIHRKAQQDVRQLVTEFNSEKAIRAGCEGVQAIFWKSFDNAVKAWQRY